MVSCPVLDSSGDLSYCLVQTNFCFQFNRFYDNLRDNLSSALQESVAYLQLCECVHETEIPNTYVDSVWTNFFEDGFFTISSDQFAGKNF